MSTDNEEQLIKDHVRLIEMEAQKHAGFVPLAKVRTEAYKIAREAAKTYNPSFGKFSTHVTNQLKKLSRISTQYGGAVRLPEDKQFRMQKINEVETAFKEEFQREPTVADLSDRTGFNLKTVNDLLHNRRKTVPVSSLFYSPTFGDDGNDDWIHFVYHDMSDRDKTIFEHKTGFGNKSKMTNTQLAKQLNTSPTTISNRLKIIGEKLDEGWQVQSN